MSIREVPLSKVSITDAFWSPRQRLMTDVTIPYMEKILRDEVPGAEKSHALKNFRMAAGEEQGEFYGMVFQDSDVAKWLEAAAYSLYLKPDKALEARVDDVIALIGRCQQPDGYLNTYFTVKEPENRWKNLLECHELYCAGHLLEAGAALYETLGKTNLLSICIRLADHIRDRFDEDGEEGIPGHQEIELGLLRMYHATGNTRYRDMALRFLDLRGQDPEWFIKHTPAHPGIHYGGYDIEAADTLYNQSDVPVREQTVARGHAVRQLYMLTAMADAASCTGDIAMQAACDRLFDNITQKQMYVTGAVGSCAHHESFSVDYDLPSGTCYGETCASVAMAFFAHSMLHLVPNGRYADLLELELYNAALAGMQLDGKRFFYVNPLEVNPEISGKAPGYEHVLVQRPQWHACACCPPNLARLIASLGKYLWSETDDGIYSHLFIGSHAETGCATLRMESAYPWEGRVSYIMEECRTEPFALNIHIPSHIQNVQVRLNGKAYAAASENGYLSLRRTWQKKDRVELSFELTPRRVHAHPSVRDAAGKTALARGPILYCLEEADNGKELSGILLPSSAAIRALPYQSDLLGGIIALEADGQRGDQQSCTLQAIPYYAWANRGKGEMSVWIRES